MPKAEPMHRWKASPAALTPRRVGELLKFVCYAMIGLTINLTGYGFYLLLTWLGMRPEVAMTILYVTGATSGFFANRMWTYRHEGSVLGASWRFAVVYGVGYVTNFALLAIFANLLGYPHQIVQAVAIVVVAVALFLLMNVFVFPSDRER